MKGWSRGWGDLCLLDKVDIVEDDRMGRMGFVGAFVTSFYRPEERSQ